MFSFYYTIGFALSAFRSKITADFDSKSINLLSTRYAKLKSIYSASFLRFYRVIKWTTSSHYPLNNEAELSLNPGNIKIPREYVWERRESNQGLLYENLEWNHQCYGSP